MVRQLLEDSSCALINLSMYLLYLSLTCTEGCNPIERNKAAKIRLNCQGPCPQVVWSLEDIRDPDDWAVSVMN